MPRPSPSRPGPLPLVLFPRRLLTADNDFEQAYQSPQTSPSSVASSGDRVMSAPLSPPPEDKNTKFRLPDEMSGAPKAIPIIRDSPSDLRGERHQDPSPSGPVSRASTPLTKAQQSDLCETSDSLSHLDRHDSVSTLAHPTLSMQLAKLTAHLPEASTYSVSISSAASQSTASDAARSLASLGERIRIWMRNTFEVTRGLDAANDVEWALSAGREGVSCVDRTIDTLEGLMCLFVAAIEDVQLRNDIAAVPANELKVVVEQMESTVGQWKGLRAALKMVKEQIELAMEWEELLDVVFQDISLEINDLSRFIFETEEKRHENLLAEMRAPPTSDGPGISVLESVVEPTSSWTDDRPSSPLLSPVSADAREDTNLVAIVARLQPLRASLDFLPMRLSSFHLRAQKHFPTACHDLQSRRRVLESKWADLQSDAQSLRDELTEDRYVFVFRNAAGQAQTMCESLFRSMAKLHEAIRLGVDHNDPPSFIMKVDNYEGKRTHYGPSIEGVLDVIRKGINDRLTAHGEILRLRSEVEAYWKLTQDYMRKTDLEILKLNLQNYQPRLSMSMSSGVSMERPNSGTTVDTTTRETSPSSSVIAAPKRGTTPSLIPRPTFTSQGRPYGSRGSSSAATRPPSSGRYTPSRLPRPISSSNRSVSNSRRSLSGVRPSTRSTSVGVESASDLIAHPRWRAASSAAIPRPMSVTSTSHDTLRHPTNNVWTSSPLSASGPRQRWRPTPNALQYLKPLPRLPPLPPPVSSTNDSHDSSRRSSLAAVLPSTSSSTAAVELPSSSFTGLQMQIPPTGTNTRWSLPASRLPRPTSQQRQSATHTPVTGKRSSATKAEKPRWRY